MKSRNNGSRIFLTELMFSILFFIIVSAICVQAFAGSFAKSREAKELTQAVNLATNAAEEYLTRDDFVSYTDYYDKNWQLLDGEEGEYKVTTLVIEPETNQDCQSMHVVVSNMDDEEIYSLVVKKAIKE
ncbi:hypothetical protein [Pseudobutyrivibrio sp.]|uniref:hypothetical protein n=1 Tax=Pseudobutyrivibrio sp. TaxID=2014367 RepID=UPI001D214BF0|nr:hypothetical protein [Pseudobutyrivibrio sp.]MBE5910839.1 type II secretion system protein [Pseudobutyrivibrio sp.]